MLAEFGLTGKYFPSRLWNHAQYGGQVYAIPFDTHPFVSYYNTEICRKAGLLDSTGRLKPLTTPEELLAALTAAKRVTGAYGLAMATRGSDPAPVDPWRLFWTLYRQLDGKLLTANNTREAIDDSKALRVLEFMRQLTETGLAAPRSTALGPSRCSPTAGLPSTGTAPGRSPPSRRPRPRSA